MKTKTVAILIALLLVGISTQRAIGGTIIHFQGAPLREGERIVGMDVHLNGVEVSSIVNIPRDWDVHLHLDSQFAPTVSASCGHGASTLTSTEELPAFEVEPFESSEKHVNGDVTLYTVKDFESGKGREVKAKISEYRPEYVPDSETAIAMAVAVWTPVYGRGIIELEKPYRAVLTGTVWHVSGTPPSGYAKGGVAEADISKGDGRIIRILHGKLGGVGYVHFIPHAESPAPLSVGNPHSWPAVSALTS